MVEQARRGERRGQLNRPCGRQRRSGHSEIVAGGCLRAEHAIAPLGHIQVDLEDALLVPYRLHHPCDQQLLRLAQVTALRRQEQVLRHLLRDGRTAVQVCDALALVLPPSPFSTASQSPPSCVRKRASSAATTARFRLPEMRPYATHCCC